MKTERTTFVKAALCALSFMILFAAHPSVFKVKGSASLLSAPVLQDEEALPKITDARVKGRKKKLVITGENFDGGSDVFINGERQQTKRKFKDSGITLIVKRGGFRMPPDEVAGLHVENSVGMVSARFDFFPGRTITLDDGGKTIRLKVGDKFLLALKRDAYDWTVSLPNQAVVEREADEPQPPDSQGVFVARQAGRVMLSATGDLPCHKVTPPCLAASLLFEVTIIVE